MPENETISMPDVRLDVDDLGMRSIMDEAYHRILAADARWAEGGQRLVAGTPPRFVTNEGLSQPTRDTYDQHKSEIADLAEELYINNPDMDAKRAFEQAREFILEKTRFMNDTE